MLITWLIGGFQRIQSAFNTMIYRVAVPSDVTGPTIVHTFRGD